MTQPNKELLARAICHRCGGLKAGPLVPCKACAFVPSAQERQVAWLFSEHHLCAEELAYAARRVREGDRPDPSSALKELAREAMGAQPVSDAALAPLGARSMLLLTAGNLLLTPLTGVALWFGMRQDRPTAARQALLVTAPIALGMSVLWFAAVVASRMGP